jgi:long-chain acyl-CoA synthetase
MKDFSTLSELILFQANKFNNPHAFNFYEKNQLKSFSNQEFLEKIFHFACGLKEIGFQKNQTLAIFSYQNPIWMIVDLATILVGGVSVPIFNNISEENLLFEISDAEIQYVFTDNPQFIEKKLPLKKIITYGFESDSAPVQVKDSEPRPRNKCGVTALVDRIQVCRPALVAGSSKNSEFGILNEIKYISFEDLISLGKKAAEEKKYNLDELVKSAKADDLATIIYTSGSTGVPKGVEITHKNLISQIKGAGEFFPLSSESDKALSFLPLAHIFERMVSLLYVVQGVEVHFIDDVKNLGNFLKIVKPTLMTSVPRMLEKVFLRIKDGAEKSSVIKKFLAQSAIQRALTKNPAEQKTFLDQIFDLLIYKKFRQAMGGKMKMMICGGAALSADMERFYSNIGVNLICGYGLTETSPVLTANCKNAHKFFTVGKAFPEVILKIADDGELLAKGPNIMRGYHNKNAAKTAEVFVDGWFKTGDLAAIDAEGFVKIIGRKKELFKNSNGKYIAPVPIEQSLVQNLEFLLGAIIIAEARKFTSAILFPEFEILSRIKEKFNCQEMSDEEFLTSERLQKFASEKIEKINHNLDSWQQIKKFYISTKPISIESGDITPSMKLKRNILEEKYKKVIDGFYVD